MDKSELPRDKASAARLCPQCAEAVVGDAQVCGACGFALMPARSASRLVMFASLVAALAVVIAVCLGIQRLLGI